MHHHRQHLCSLMNRLINFDGHQSFILSFAFFSFLFTDLWPPLPTHTKTVTGNIYIPTTKGVSESVYPVSSHFTAEVAATEDLNSSLLISFEELTTEAQQAQPSGSPVPQGSPSLRLSSSHNAISLLDDLDLGPSPPDNLPTVVCVLLQPLFPCCPLCLINPCLVFEQQQQQQSENLLGLPFHPIVEVQAQEKEALREEVKHGKPYSLIVMDESGAQSDVRNPNSLLTRFSNNRLSLYDGQSASFERFLSLFPFSLVVTAFS